MHTPFITAFAAVLATTTALAQPLKYPGSQKKPVTDTYHGTTISEDYRWLEDGKDAGVRDWSLKQLEVTRGFLDRLPQRGALKQQLTEIYNGSPVRYFSFQQTSGAFFALKRQPPKNQPMLVVMRSAGDLASERVLVDPNTLQHTAIDFYEPSLDGRYVAVSLSEKGTEDGTAHVFDVATGQRLKDVVPRVAYPTGGG